MNINKINPYINILNDFSSKNQKNITKINYEIKDSVSFSGKNKQQDDKPILTGANYDSIIKGDIKKPNRTILNLKKAVKNGENISKEREALILSRIPKAIEIAEEIVLKYPNLDINDVEQDLIRIIIEQTDKDLSINNKQNSFTVLFKSALREYVSQLKSKQNEQSKNTPMPKKIVTPQNSPYDKIEDEELKTKIINAKGQLPSAQQFVINERFGFGNKPQELSKIANELGVTHQCVSARIQSGIENIRKILEDAD